MSTCKPASFLSMNESDRVLLHRIQNSVVSNRGEVNLNEFSFSDWLILKRWDNQRFIDINSPTGVLARISLSEHARNILFEGQQLAAKGLV